MGGGGGWCVVCVWGAVRLLTRLAQRCTYVPPVGLRGEAKMVRAEALTGEIDLRIK